MSFDRLNTVLKQISSSNSYLSIEHLLEEYFVDRTNQFTSDEQEKFFRVCLRKLFDWFTQNPNQIQEIKIKFHRLCLQTTTQLKQKQIIDSIIHQLNIRHDHFLFFLLVDVYQQNYSKLLEQLEEQVDSSYIVHLPDRIANLCMTNVPLCFQITTYFNRLSRFIEEQLVNVHYPNLVAQKETNIKYLSELIHKSAKLGYTEFVWAPLYQNVFLQKCPTDSLWLRLIQYFLLDTLDEILVYTIGHVNAQMLDLFLSDRIVHMTSLETYLTETLIFCKQLPIEQIRTILIYLTMSTKRTKQCFQPVFRRFLHLWSQESFIRFSSNWQHLLICQSICICLSLNKSLETIDEKDKLMFTIFNGIRVHLESTLDYIRQRGQILGELLVARLDLFSASSQLTFHCCYDQNHPEVQLLNKFAETNDDRQLANDEILSKTNNSQDQMENRREKQIATTKSIVLREASANDDDDDDSEFECYDCSNDTVKSEIPKPTYIRTCLADLLSTDKVSQLEAALHVLPSVIEMSKIECEEVALELVRILLNYNSTFDIDNFNELQLNGLIALCSNYPLTISQYITKQFYERNYTIQQRSLILKTIEESARRLSNVDEIRSEIEKKLLESDDESESDDQFDDRWRSIINQRLKLKTKYKRKIRSEKKILAKENHFSSIVGHFFFPLLSQIDQNSVHLSLIDGDQDYLLLCELLACLARLCIHSQNTFILITMIKQFFQLLKLLQTHSDAGVRHAVVYSYACSLISINSNCHDDDLQLDIIAVKQWLDKICFQDTNTEVQQLARAVRQILLKTLQELTTY